MCVCLARVSEEEVVGRSVGRSVGGRSAGAAPKVRTPHNDVGKNGHAKISILGTLNPAILVLYYRYYIATRLIIATLPKA